MGTVGAVALDITGNLAAATSTGGMTGKPVGRVGDTPIIGAGTWADDTIAVSVLVLVKHTLGPVQPHLSNKLPSNRRSDPFSR